jgi:fucose permease
LRYTFKDTLHACYLGYFTQAINNNLAPLFFIIFQARFGISLEMLGRLILLNFGTQIIVDVLAVRYVDRIGYRLSALLGNVFSATGLMLFGILPFLTPSPFIGLGIAAVIQATGGSIIEVLLSPIVESLPGEAKESAMSMLHSFYCWGQMGVIIITTLLLWVLGTDLWYLLPCAWAILPIYNFFRFRKVPLRNLVPTGEETPAAHLFRVPAFFLALVLMFAAGASELTMSQWSSLFAQQGLQIPKVIGDLVGPGLFALLMGIGRTAHGLWGHRFDLRKALVFSGILCILCYSVAVFAAHPLVALLACALTGLSISLMWPGTVSLTVKAFPRGGTPMFGIMTIFGNIGAAFGPWMAGAVADVSSWGLRSGLLLAVIFPTIFLLGLRRSDRARIELSREA